MAAGAGDAQVRDVMSILVKNSRPRFSATCRVAVPIIVCALMGIFAACGGTKTAAHRTFDSPDAAVRALTQAVKKGDLEEVVAIFGPDGQALVDSSDPVTARRNREIFVVAVAEGWRLEDDGAAKKTLVIGSEAWPFPIPLVKEGNQWRFDTAAGKEEVIARRIGRNELATIQICRTYVAAQQLYARRGHDGQREGLYAATFRSDPGRQNGLYWPAARGEKRSPLGELLAHAAQEGAVPARDGAPPPPFHGYYFRILTAQGPAATGGASDYMKEGKLSGGFALVAWPAQYDVTGVMTFIVNHEGVVFEKDLGSETGVAARAMDAFNPDTSWARVE